jgi:hypothetical protein
MSVSPNKKLPADVFFMGSQSVFAAGQASDGNMPSAGGVPANEAVLANGMMSAETGWSQPIFFYPDGTTSSVRLWLRNKDGRMIELYLRGLTGVVKVGNVTTTAQTAMQ